MKLELDSEQVRQIRAYRDTFDKWIDASGTERDELRTKMFERAQVVACFVDAKVKAEEFMDSIMGKEHQA